jgi:ADP-heptose:LPS heptosyltransferase
VAVIRLRSLGDCILTTPALEILRESWPDSAIAVVVEDRFADVFEGNPDVDAVLPPSVTELRCWRPQLCLNLHGGTRSLALTLLSGAEIRAGFAHFRGAFTYHVRIPTVQQILGDNRKRHTAEQLASAIFYLGAPRREVPRAKLYAAPPKAGPPYAVIHPAATGSGKMWPAGKFLEVAQRLDLEPVFIAGAGEDLSAFQPFRTLAGAPLSEVKSLMAGASLFIGNDSGPAHMAAAFGLPVVVIFGNSDPVVWAPWKTVSETIVARGVIEDVSVEEVLAAAGRVRVAA